MSCPKCGGNDIVLGGKYKVKRTRILIQRLRCRDCNATFVVKNKNFKKRIGIRIRKKILSLYKTRKPNVNKFDGTHKRTFSTREVARMLGVSKSFVHKVISDKKQDFNKYIYK